jgi:hypothetical protein
MVEENASYYFHPTWKLNISHNGNKSVENYNMDLGVFIAMGAMYEVDTHRVNGMCAHTLNDAYN